MDQWDVDFLTWGGLEVSKDADVINKSHVQFSVNPRGPATNGSRDSWLFGNLIHGC